MSKHIPPWIKINVMQEWLLGMPRHTIAENNKIGDGSVTRIIYKFKNEISDVDLLRALVLTLKKGHLTVFDFASAIRIRNRLKELHLEETHIESFFDVAIAYCFRHDLDEV